MTPAFQYTSTAQKVVFASGELGSLGDHLDGLGVQCALLCTSQSYVRNGAVDRVKSALGTRLAAVFAEAKPHVPDTTVDSAAAMAKDLEVDAVMALGGGSAIGTAKALAAALHEWHPDEAFLPIVAVPTTYAGSELTPMYGVTRTTEGRKAVVTDPRCIPRLVVYDPDLTLDLPPDLTAGTGMNALAHCVEGLYSTGRTPVTTATALAGIAAIFRSLPACITDGRDAGARREMLIGAYLASTTVANAKIALHHAICQALGGTAGVPHGVANTIMLPHVMRFNRVAAVTELAAMARTVNPDRAGMPDAALAEAAVEETADLTRSLGMPQRLRDAGVSRDDFPRLATVTLHSAPIKANPRPVTDAVQIEGILASAW
jgi:maleylacetate reductase